MSQEKLLLLNVTVLMIVQPIIIGLLIWWPALLIVPVGIACAVYIIRKIQAKRF